MDAELMTAVSGAIAAELYGAGSTLRPSDQSNVQSAAQKVYKVVLAFARTHPARFQVDVDAIIVEPIAVPDTLDRMSSPSPANLPGGGA